MKFDDVFEIKKQFIIESLECRKYSNFTKKNVFEYFDQKMEHYNKKLSDFKNKIKNLPYEERKRLKEEIFSLKIVKDIDESIFKNESRSLKRVQKIQEHVSHYKSKNPNMNFCEVGTDNGAFTIKNLIDKNILDSSASAGIEIIPEKCYYLSLLGIDMYIANLLKDDILKLKIEKRDLVLMTEVIEHMPTENCGFDVIKNALKLLNKKGTLIISYPKDASPITNEPGGHQYQPVLENILDNFKSLFKNVKLDDDGARQIIIFEELI